MPQFKDSQILQSIDSVLGGSHTLGIGAESANHTICILWNLSINTLQTVNHGLTDYSIKGLCNWQIPTLQIDKSSVYRLTPMDCVLCGFHTLGIENSSIYASICELYNYSTIYKLTDSSIPSADSTDNL